MPPREEPLQPFGPRDAGARSTSRLGRMIAAVLVVGVLATTYWWSSALARGDRSQANPWKSDPPVVSLSQRERDAMTVVGDHPDALMVLTYHEVSVRAGTSAGGAYTVSPETFSTQLAALKEAGYRSVRLAEVADFVAGRGALPPRPVLITFDDGHATDLGVADPILAQYGFTAVAFLITGSLSSGAAPSYYLSTPEVQTLRETGRWEFGSHTNALHFRKDDGTGRQLSALDHRLPTEAGPLETFEAWYARVDRDLGAAQASLAAQLGASASAFAYPFNAFGQDDAEMGPGEPKVRAALAALLRRHGFTLGFAGSGADAAAVYAGDDPLTLRRLSMRNGMDAAQLLYVMDEMLPTRLPEAAALRWRSAVGDCVAQEGGVRAVATGAAGASCRPVLNPDLWSDYEVTATVGPFAGQAHPVLTLRDGHTYSTDDRLELELAAGAVTVREVVAGRSRAIGTATVARVGAVATPLRVRVVGRTLSVWVGGRQVPVTPLRTAGRGGFSVGALGVGESGRRNAGAASPSVTWRDVRVSA